MVFEDPCKTVFLGWVVWVLREGELEQKINKKPERGTLSPFNEK